MTNDNIELGYALISYADLIDFDTQAEIIFCKEQYALVHKQKDLITLLKLHMVSEGKKITRDITSSAIPNNSSLSKLIASRGYAQFGELVDILGEYIDKQDPLSRYMAIYHVVENFMCRVPIARLERRNSGAMFSIRDFKELYRAVSESEKSSLKQLVLETFKLIHDGVRFGRHVQLLWERFLHCNHDSIGDVDMLLQQLIGRSSEVSSGDFPVFFSTVIYQVRCSLVHNKETEYHISTQNYDVGCKLLLEKFLLPVLEELVFLLLCEENDLIWYRNENIKLWDQLA